MRSIIALLERDGNICQGCLLPFSHIDAMNVDHIDNDPDHRCLANKQLLCTECNNRFNKVRIFDSRLNGVQTLRVRKENCKCGYVPAGASAPDPDQVTKIRHVGDRHYITEPTLAGILANVATGKDPTEGLSPAAPVDPELERRQAQVLSDEKEDAALTPTMRKNKKCEKPFNKWLNQRIAEGARHNFQEWCNAGANRFECSPDTIRKYLDKRTNPENGDLTVIKPDIETPAYLGFKEIQT